MGITAKGTPHIDTLTKLHTISTASLIPTFVLHQNAVGQTNLVFVDHHQAFLGDEILRVELHRNVIATCFHHHTVLLG